MIQVQPIKYDGSVAHFRGEMDRILAIDGEIYQIQNDGGQMKEYQISYYSEAQTSTREVWNIIPIIPIINGKSEGNSKFAMVLATEPRTGSTTVEFLDGRCYERTAYAFRGTIVSNSDLSPAHLAMHDPIGDDLVKLSNIIRDKILKQAGNQNKRLDEPQTRNLNDWFIYYYKCKNSRIKLTLKDIADKTNYSYDYVRQKHLEYKHEHEI